jgi:hypothetical protein
MTKKELFLYQGDSDDFEQDSDDYFAMRAIEIHGWALRDNSYAELVAIGKREEQAE